MKKLVLASVLALGSLTAFAATPVVLENNNETVNTIQEEYQEIDVAEVPQAVTDALAADFPGAEISKAYKNEASEYKLDVMVGEETTTLYANENGDWIQK
ncbi:hypothetical protein HX109_07360 [Galbibacter sp. BG1]|uniref:hypothetical protein n=1 Tax=Galbibacter sp. BG1 TaxID=1170699 RepID=UPI0015C05AF3|nr:hypothetical protein [Galbibacter sp. BG1]QLE01389.1 hypothetical protein HX109_07360 [Galbibacter sp. BG1]